MKILCSVLLIGICVAHTTSAFIYEARVVRKWGPRKNIIGLSDFHDKTHTSTVEQQTQLEQIMARCHKKNTRLIVEDLSSCASNGRNSCGPFVINSRGGILGGLTQRCQESGLTVDNVEYRYCRVASLGPVINNIEQTEMPFQSTNTILIGVLLQEIDDSIKEIKTYNDGPRFNALYKKIVREVQSELSRLKLPEMRHVSVAQYMHHHSTPDNRLDVLNKVLTVDSMLLDIKVLHSVIHAPESTIIIIAGGSHMIRVCNWLVQYGGYQHVYVTPLHYGREYNLLNCVGTPLIEGTYCMRPEPIDLGVVMQYI
ncbi:MAG: hypothetical protein ACHQVS_01050 [Candidatus Babeliales bacterium]